MTALAMEAVDRGNLDKIESYFNTSTYREIMEVSATFNSRLSVERRLRLPFLDPQTGVAQRHSALYVKAKQRLPGLRCGQLYSFPAARWRKTKRQYLTTMMADFQSVLTHQSNSSSSGVGTSNGTISGGGHYSSLGSSIAGASGPGGFLFAHHDENSNSNASFLLDKSLSNSGAITDGVLEDTNSRDTNNNSKDEILARDWIYDDLDNDFDSEPKSAEDEYDYDPRYGSKKLKKKVKKEGGKGKKGYASSSAFGFDFNTPSGAGTTKTRRSKDSAATPKKNQGAESGAGTERRTRRKNAGVGGKNKKFIEPPSFESAAAGFDDQFGGSGVTPGWI